MDLLQTNRPIAISKVLSVPTTRRFNEAKKASVFGVLLFVVLGIVALAPTANAQLTASDFTYQGAFTIPSVIQNGQYIHAYGQRGMYFDPDGDPGGPGDGFTGSLWVNTHDYNRDFVEISIPVPVNSTTYNSLSTAAVLTNSLSLDMGTCTVDTPYLTGLTITDNYVWTSCSRWYNVSNRSHDNLYRWNLDLTNPVQFHAGPESGEDFLHSNLTGSWLAEVPADWAATNTGGKTLIAGHSRNSHGGTLGPTIYALDEFNPESPATKVLHYRQSPEFPSPLDCNTNACDFPNYSACDRWWDAEWIDSSTDDALIMVGKNCYGGNEYIAGAGWICDPCYGEVIFYDPDDLAASATGMIDPWLPIPYETWRPNEAWITNGEFGGAAYDAENGVFYLIEKKAEGGKSIIHVYTTQAAPPAPDYPLVITKSGTGAGTVTSSPAGISCGTDCQETYDTGTAVQLAASPQTGSLFAGWTGHSDCSDGAVVMSSSRSCTAWFDLIAPSQFLLTVTKSGTGGGTVTSSPSGIDCGTDCQQSYDDGQVVGLSAVADSGSIFSGWSGDADCGDGTVSMSDDRDCMAHFALETNTGQSVCPAYTESSLYRPRQRQLAATPSNWISLIQGSQPGDEILLADGIYSMNQYTVGIGSDDVTIRSASGNRDAVTIQGQGYGTPAEGFMIMAANVTIADLTMTGMRNHGISIKGENGAEAPHIYNVHLFDIGTQHIKGTPGDGVNNGVVACSKIGYTPGGVRGDYLHAIDIHGAIDWNIRDNEIYNIWGDGSGCEVDIDCGTYTPGGGPAIIVWNNASGNVIERNRIIDSFRGIALGFYGTHVGGVVINNFVYQSESGRPGVNGWINADAGISIWGSNTEIDHNTVITNGSYPGAIEVWDSTNLKIRNNLITQPVWNRGNSTFTAQGNKTDATVADLIAPGDPHLNPASEAVDFSGAVTIPGNMSDIDGETRFEGAGPDVGADEVFDDGSPPQYTLTIAKAGDGQGTVASAPGGIDCGADCSQAYNENTVVQLTATPSAGSEFAGWWGPSDCLDGQVTVDSDFTCTATFSLVAPPMQQFDLTVWRTGNGAGTVTSSPAGIDCGNDCLETFDEGTVVQLAAAPSAGSEFTGWSGAGDCSDGQVTVTGDLDCTATFSEISLPEEWGLTVRRLGNGSGIITASEGVIDCGLYCSQDYDEGTQVQLFATPDANSQFTGWSGDSDCGDGILDMTNVRSCNATFSYTGTLQPGILSVSLVGGAQNAQGSVTSTPSGIDCGADCSEGFAGGEVVRLEAVPDSGWAFGGWWGPSVCHESIQGAGGEVSFVQVHEDIACTAVFVSIGEEVVYALGFESGDLGLE